MKVKVEGLLTMDYIFEGVVEVREGWTPDDIEEALERLYADGAELDQILDGHSIRIDWAEAID